MCHLNRLLLKANIVYKRASTSLETEMKKNPRKPEHEHKEYKDKRSLNKIFSEMYCTALWSIYCCVQKVRIYVKRLCQIL